jgi:hypothetical protein
MNHNLLRPDLLPLLSLQAIRNSISFSFVFLVRTVIDVEMEINLVEHLYSYMGKGEVCS